MKNQKKITTLLASTLIVLMISGYSIDAFGQEDTKMKVSKFLIFVETTDEGMKFTSKDGCAWKELTFSLAPYVEQAVDKFGMATLSDSENNTTTDPSSFLFTVKKTEDGVFFKGLQGTAWTKLSFTISEKKGFQAIDQYGMTDDEM